jgi:hypothetical protein
MPEPGPTTPSTTSDQVDTESSTATIDRLTRALDDWRARIDELLVQVDVASLDVREQARARLEVTENVYLAAKSRLAQARHDAGKDVTGLWEGLDQLLGDLRLAYEDSLAVVGRSRKPSP